MNDIEKLARNHDDVLFDKLTGMMPEGTEYLEKMISNNKTKKEEDLDSDEEDNDSDSDENENENEEEDSDDSNESLEDLAT